MNIRTQSILLRRNSNGLTTDVPFANNTFEHSAGIIFNHLPKTVWENDNYNIFGKEVKQILTERAQARIL